MRRKPRWPQGRVMKEAVGFVLFLGLEAMGRGGAAPQDAKRSRPGSGLLLEDWLLPTIHHCRTESLCPLCQEHPLLGQPFFMLHPCRTREFMKQLLDHSRPVNYVLSWLSVVGPVVGLHIPLQYYTKAHPADGRPR